MQKNERLNDIWLKFLQVRDDQSRSELILNYVPLVKYVVDHLSLCFSATLSREDLVSAGIVGLINAVERFEPSKGVKFETYAVTRIKGSIIDETRKLDWVPRSKRRMIREIQRAFEDIEREEARPATDDEVAKKIGITVEELNKVLEKADTFSFMSLDQVIRSAEGSATFRVIDTCKNDEKNEPQNVLDKKELVNALVEAINILPEQDRMVLALYYYNGLTLTEISDIMSLSTSRISQVHTKAILRLRSRILSSFFGKRSVGEKKKWKKRKASRVS